MAGLELRPASSSELQPAQLAAPPAALSELRANAMQTDHPNSWDSQNQTSPANFHQPNRFYGDRFIKLQFAIDWICYFYKLFSAVLAFPDIVYVPRKK